jgi:hypothetical protein
MHGAGRVGADTAALKSSVPTSDGFWMRSLDDHRRERRMRALGITLVTLALVLGAGGVARRPLADTTAPDATGQTPATPPSAQGATEGGTCTGPAPRSVEIDLTKVEQPKGFVSLNSRGYNYRQPGDPPQLVPDSTGKQRPAELLQP